MSDEQSEPPAPSGTTRFVRSVGPYVVLILSVLATWGRILGHDFVLYDDHGHITDNPHLDPVTLAGVARFWRGPFFGHYVPVSYTVFATEAWLAQSSHDVYGKQQFDPAVFHAVSLGLHLICVLLAYSFLRMIVQQPWAACLGACLFGLHPLQAESVAWASEQRGLLAALFSFLSLMAYVRFDRGVLGELRPRPPIAPNAATGGLGWYLLASLAYGLALLAKPSAASVPLIAAVLDVFWLRRSWRVTLAALLPWLAIAAVMVVITRHEQPTAGAPYLPPWWMRPLIAGDALQFYLSKLVWPVDLIIQYPRSPRIVREQPWIYIAWLVPAVVLAVCYRFRAQGPWLLCAGWFVAALAPVLGLVTFGYQHFSTVADRYVYLALFAPALALAWWLGQPRSRSAIAMAIAILLVFAVASFRQAGHWRDSESLFMHTIQLNPRSEAAYGGWGAELLRQGRFAEALDYLDESYRIGGTQTGSERDYVNRARALLGAGRIDEAIVAYQQALAASPDSTFAHQNLSAAYFQKQDWDSAIRHSQIAITAEPANSIARFNLALSLEKAGRNSEALEQFRELLAQRPAHHPARLKLGMQLARDGQLDEAMRQFRQILAQHDDPAAHAELAAALVKQGDVNTALRHYQHALERESPFWAAIANRLAWLRATHPSPEIRDGRQAVALAEQACRMTNYQAPEFIQSLAAAQAEAGDFDQAVALAQQASDLARQTGQSQRAAEIQEQLQGFRQRRPYRNAADGSPAALP